MKKILLTLIIGMFLINFIHAEPNFFVPEGKNYSLKFGCDIYGKNCEGDVICKISISYPNSTILVNNKTATNLYNGYFNYTLNHTYTTPKGEYTGLISCNNGTLGQQTPFSYEVNQAGIPTSESRTQTTTRSIYLTFILSVILFLAFLFTKQSFPVKWTFFLVSCIFFLISINTLFIGMLDEVVNPSLETFFSFLTAASYYFYWFAFGLIAVMWILTFLQTMFYNKLDRMANKYG